MEDDQAAEPEPILYGTAGVPSYLSTDYEGSAYRPYPSAALAWLFTALCLLFCGFVFVAVPLGIRAARGGNRRAWLAVGLAVLLAGFSPIGWYVAANP